MSSWFFTFVCSNIVCVTALICYTAIFARHLNGQSTMHPRSWIVVIGGSYLLSVLCGIPVTVRAMRSDQPTLLRSFYLAYGLLALSALGWVIARVLYDAYQAMPTGD